MKRPLSKRPKIGFQDQLSLNADRKHCRMLQEHSAIHSTFIRLPFVIKIFVLSIFEWPFYTCFTVELNSSRITELPINGVIYYHATTSLAKVVHEIKFGDIAVTQIVTIYGIMTGIVILISSLRCLKDMILGLSVHLDIVSLFSVNVVGAHCIEAITMCTYNICLSNS